MNELCATVSSPYYYSNNENLADRISVAVIHGFSTITLLIQDKAGFIQNFSH